jgi:hypothetical protein
MKGVVVLLGLCGCSFLTVQGPPSERPAHGAVTCTSTGAAPFVDVALAIASGVAVYRFIEQPVTVTNFVAADFVDFVHFAAVGIPLDFTGSAVYGAIRTSNCRRAKAVGPTYTDAEWARRQPPPALFCTTSPDLKDLCFCSHVQAECEERQRSITAMGAAMSTCMVSPNDRCTTPSPLPPAYMIPGPAPAGEADPPNPAP